jgi:hypothetical protein
VAAGDWRLAGLDPATLELEVEYALPQAAFGLAIAPDGDAAYALAGPWDLGGNALLHVDLISGASAIAGRVPGPSLAGPTVTANRIYVPISTGAALWVGDSQGRPVTMLPAGRNPSGIVVAG